MTPSTNTSLRREFARTLLERGQHYAVWCPQYATPRRCSSPASRLHTGQPPFFFFMWSALCFLYHAQEFWVQPVALTINAWSKKSTYKSRSVLITPLYIKKKTMICFTLIVLLRFQIISGFNFSYIYFICPKHNAYRFLRS